MRRAALVLARLALRRALPWPLLAGAVLVLALGALPGATLPDAVAVDAQALGRMLARARLWMITAVVATLVCVPRAALAGAGARKVQGDLVAASALARWVDVLATWAGTAAAGWIVLLCGACCAELSAGGSGPALARADTLDNPQLRLIADDEARWDLPRSSALDAAAADPRARLALEAIALPRQGPATMLAAFVATDGEAGAAVEMLLSGRARLLVPIGAGARPTLVVRRDERGAAVLIPASSVELLLATPFGERSASLRLCTSGALALGAACALALGLGTWLQAWIASFGVLAAALAPVLLGLRTLPGSRVGALLSGNVPAPLLLREAAVLAALTLAGLVLASSARGRRREG